MKLKRRKSKVIKIGRVSIGGNYPIAIQSMAKTKTRDIEGTIGQIKELEKAGCEIVRVAVKDKPDAQAIKRIRPKITIPLVADIHFDWRLAVAAADNGADKIRLNPGNISKKEDIHQVVCAAKQNRIPIRIGLNSGSLPGVTSHKLQFSDRIVRAALDYIKIIEKFGFYNLIISLKASNIFDTIAAYRQIASRCDYPLHLGLTATGLPQAGAIKSSIAIGALLLEGIGDTIRVSLTGSPLEEVKVAKLILASLSLRNFGPQIISCPTCGRCEVDLARIVRDLEARLSANAITRPMKLAIMGCVVNGPGEAKEADLGVAFGKQEGLLFKKGRPKLKVSTANCLNQILEEIKN